MTGSGKTHTVNGSSSDPGVLPRTLARVFRFVERSNRERATAGDTSADLIVTLSYLEVYNEKVYDLFADTRVPLDVVAAPSGKMHVRGMRQSALPSMRWRTPASPPLTLAPTRAAFCNYRPHPFHLQSSPPNLMAR